MRSLRNRLWKLWMHIRFPRAPIHPRTPDGRYQSRKEWRLEQMRAGL